VIEAGGVRVQSLSVTITGGDQSLDLLSLRLSGNVCAQR
jgi:hypothetical protein